MKVSVIVPSYKPKDYLWECLDSLRQQTLPKSEYEVVLVLNGCCEPYQSNILAYLKSKYQDVNTQFLCTTQGGVSNARNMGIELSRGGYLAFVDDDDYVSDVYLEELVKIADQGYVPLSNVIAVRDGDKKELPYRITDLFHRRKGMAICRINEVRSFLSVPVAKVLAKGTVGSRRFNNNYKIGEDSLFVFEISDRLKKFKCTSEKAVYYRRYREGSAITSRKNPKDVWSNAMKLMAEYSKIYFRRPFSYNFIFYLSRLGGTIMSARILSKQQ